MHGFQMRPCISPSIIFTSCDLFILGKDVFNFSVVCIVSVFSLFIHAFRDEESRSHFVDLCVAVLVAMEEK